MKVLITQHFFRSSAASLPAELVEAITDHQHIPLADIDEGFKQEVVEVERLIDAVAYDCGLDPEDLSGEADELDPGWVVTPYGIFISTDEQCASYVILEAATSVVHLR